MDSLAREKLLGELYSAHSAEVLKFGLRRGATQVDAEELVAETFMVCWRRLAEVPDPALPWLLGVARRVLANQRRSERRRLAVYLKAGHNPGHPVGGTHDEDPMVARLRGALAALSERDREVLALVAWQGLTHEGAATVLGCSRNAVTKRLARARRNLQAQLSSCRT